MKAVHRRWHVRMWITCGLAAIVVLVLGALLRKPSAISITDETADRSIITGGGEPT
jgi:hypothetical protein